MPVANQRVAINPCLDANASLGIDEACFSVLNEYNIPVTLYSYLSDCYLVRISYIELFILFGC